MQFATIQFNDSIYISSIIYAKKKIQINEKPRMLKYTGFYTSDHLNILIET